MNSPVESMVEKEGREIAEHAGVFLNSLGHSLAEETRQRRGVLGDSGEPLAVSVTKQKPFLLSSSRHSSVVRAR